MRAMVLERPGEALRLMDLPTPQPGPHDVLISIAACGVCRTDLHLRDGELPDPSLPLVPGHEVVGRVVACGDAVDPAVAGARVGVPWLGGSCRSCRHCRAGRENLCEAAVFTGYTRAGGYAEQMVADARYVFPVPDAYDDVSAAPLLCAGLIGFRALRFTGDARRLGLYGFGASAHIVAQIARYEGRVVFAFTRPGDTRGQQFARSLGAEWAGGSDERPPEPLDAAIIFAPAGPLVLEALRSVDRGGVVVCAGIHMSDVPALPYSLLWGERVVRSVANLTREDGVAFFDIAPRVPVRTTTERWPLGEAEAALDRLRGGLVDGAAVLVP
jgi:alcohol dehydrogenase, propanol-preferring